MMDAFVEKNLKMFRERAVLSSRPTGSWEYRLAMYRERENYEMLGDWQPLPEGFMFHTTQTFFGRMRFTPVAPRTGQTAYLKLCTAAGCEAFVLLNGVRYAGVNNDQGRNCLYFPEELYGKETEIEIELFASRHEGNEGMRNPIQSCRWIIEDDVLTDFSRNLDLLWSILPHAADRWNPAPQETNEYKTNRMRALLEKILRESDQALEGEEYRENILALNETLKKELVDMTGDEDRGTLACVASTHIDVAWKWQYKDTIRKAARSSLNQFRIMDRYPEFEFTMSQPSVYNYIKEVYPDVFAEIKKRVAEGTWQLVGPMWVESDLNLSGAETLIREFLYGHQFFLKEFGKTSDVCWIPDSFGFPATLPAIFTRCGMKSFYTTKVRWQTANYFPYNVFVWEGLDKSRILSTIPDTRGYNGNIEPGLIRYSGDHIQQKAVWDKTLFVYGYGDGGGGPAEKMLENYRRLKNYPTMPRLELTRAGDYFAELETKRDQLPVWKGELYVETHQGTYTTIAENKRSNRYAEMAYRRLDLLAALAGYRGGSPEYDEIVKNYKDLLLLQFHDVLPGSSIDDVYRDTDRMYADLFAFAEKKQIALTDAVFAPKKNEECVTVFNPNSFPGTAYVRVSEAFAGCAMTDGSRTANVLPDGAGHYVFLVEGLEGFASRIYRKAAPIPAHSRVTLAKTENGISVETPFFTFTLAGDGTLHRFYDKRQGVYYTEEKGLNRFVTYKDGPELEDAWNIDREYKLRPYDMQWQDTVKIVENNGERVVIRLHKTNGKTTLTQDITVYADIARVDFFSHINWQEKYKILQVSFPTSIISQQASYEIAYGVVRRGTHANTPAERWRHEYAAHRFTDLSDDVRGAALLNDCKYGHNVIDQDMIMTLFRSTDFPAHFYDLGEHDFAYAFLPHEGGLRAAGVAAQGYLFNSPFVVMEGEAEHNVPLSLSHAGMIVDCVKPAEDGNGIIVRMYEPYGTSGCVTVTLASDAEVLETSPLENTLEERGVCGSFAVSYKPFDIRTFRIIG